jgi:sodium-independent sulfate anion transporter 11
MHSGNIDTTGVQALVDTRNEVERWVDGPVEFHFANILSPWVRRGLVAGGFGLGEHSSPVEIAPVVDSQEYASNAPPDWKLDTQSPTSKKGQIHDIESNEDNEAYKKKTASDGGSENLAEGPLLSAVTPFFHVDLASAVAAAEKTALRKNDNHSS